MACRLLIRASSTTASTGDIAKVAEVKSGFGHRYTVTDAHSGAIDPRVLFRPQTARRAEVSIRLELCASGGRAPAAPTGLQGNMASAGGSGSRFVVIAVETSSRCPAPAPGKTAAR